ncbi:hypothetical protein BDQ94DRAFT_137204 [Aspergillus welwitschiae]|uniref:Secreted protein n=1 Tax=Aspergillus welwitschiae TaxID=1341132 RepID=A0A3F3QD39_9EURO|nr:hypothetical protein BDQ94DRAFT_137204 [Aspergillus welwitschiae]RDH36969.1 hypothetical protein BDQ94DRAFT_137204 [Aspergillus welwitschiae]
MNIPPINALERYFCLFYLSLMFSLLLTGNQPKLKLPGCDLTLNQRNGGAVTLPSFPPFLGGQSRLAANSSLRMASWSICRTKQIDTCWSGSRWRRWAAIGSIHLSTTSRMLE